MSKELIPRGTNEQVTVNVISGTVTANQGTGGSSPWLVKEGVNTPTNSAALVTNIAKPGAGTLFSGTGRVDGTATAGTYYLLFIDAAAAVNGAVTRVAPSQQFVMDGSTSQPFSFESPQGGVAVAAGAVLALSTTEFTLTLAGAFLSGGIETK